LNFEALLQAIQKGDDDLLNDMIDVIQVETIRKQCCESQVCIFKVYLEVTDNCIFSGSLQADVVFKTTVIF
jgi:hypothetical protein